MSTPTLTGGPPAAVPAPPPVAFPGRLEKAAILFLVGFLLIFPKGGFKLAGIPITWGYAGLGLMMLTLPAAMLASRSWPLARVRLLCLALLVPFQLVIAGSLIAHGTDNLGFAVSLVVTFFFVPPVFLLAIGIHLDRLDLGYLFRLLRFGVLAVAIYGIFLFFFRLSTGAFIEIPYLTVNVDDVGGMEDKYIDRGGIFKLISTYNNGNIYGLCMLILLPLYTWLEGSPWKNVVVRLSLVLTLSRTVWLGLILHELLQLGFVKRLSVRTVIILGLSIAVIVGGVAAALSLLGVSPAFLVDRNLGGRAAQLLFVETATLLPAERFEHILEMVYLSVLHNFGVLGLFAFLVAMGGPLLLYATGLAPFAGSAYKRSLLVGLVVYLLVATSDGAILFIPVMAFYWFVVSLLLSANPSYERLRPVTADSRQA